MRRSISCLSAMGVFFLAFSCMPSTRDIVKETFPDCFAEPMIGASSGARCEYDEEREEWRITFWRGWGDCPAGCIHKEDLAWYLVDKKGRVFECDRTFKTLAQVPAGEVITIDKVKARVPAAGPGGPVMLAPGGQAKPPAPAAKDPQTQCQVHDDCFWYSCCRPRPMSKLYRKDHWQELQLSAPDHDTCIARCEHQPAPPDQRLACVARQCTAVPRDAPAIDPAREVV